MKNAALEATDGGKPFYWPGLLGEAVSGSPIEAFGSPAALTRCGVLSSDRPVALRPLLSKGLPFSVPLIELWRRSLPRAFHATSRSSGSHQCINAPSGDT